MRINFRPRKLMRSHTDPHKILRPHKVARRETALSRKLLATIHCMWSAHQNFYTGSARGLGACNDLPPKTVLASFGIHSSFYSFYQRIRQHSTNWGAWFFYIHIARKSIRSVKSNWQHFNFGLFSQSCECTWSAPWIISAMRMPLGAIP